MVKQALKARALLVCSTSVAGARLRGLGLIRHARPFRTNVLKGLLRAARFARLSCRVAALALTGVSLTLGLAVAQQGGKPSGRSGADRPAQERGAEKAGAAPVVGCPSLANYRVLMRHGPAAAAAVLADPKADHLGCAALARGRITGIADHVALGGQAYDCAGVQGTTACHWMDAGTVPVPRVGGR